IDAEVGSEGRPFHHSRRKEKHWSESRAAVQKQSDAQGGEVKTGLTLVRFAHLRRKDAKENLGD
uniref:hypothetical protein n=1 Tax=uncultured Desulfuromonas sp. TaxID=181013 RepID=UPI0026071B66